MSAAYDLSPFLLSDDLRRVATEALTSIDQAQTLAQIKQRLTKGHAVLDALEARQVAEPLDVRFVRGVLNQQADVRHGAVWPK